MVQGNKTPEFLRHSSTLPSTSKLRHPAKSLSPLASLLPSASLVSSTSNYLARKRIPEDSSSFMPVKSYPKRDVYQYPTEDLEEEWTTLPSKKRKRKPKFFSVSVVFDCVNIFLGPYCLIQVIPSRFVYEVSAYRRR